MCSCSGSCDCNSVTIPRGPQGEKGDLGPTGPQGSQGPIGNDGPIGPQGPSGVVDVEAPIINTGLSPSSAIIGIDINELVTLINTSNVGGGFIPTGAIIAFGGTTPPAGWLICGGGEISRFGTNAALYAVIGNIYGDGDGTNTFNLPDLRHSVPVGYDFSLPPFDELGYSDGEVDHLLLKAEIPKHNHIIGSDGVNGATLSNPGNHTHPYVNRTLEGGDRTGNSGVDNLGFNDDVITDGGGAHVHSGVTDDGTGYGVLGESHNNMQPYLVINYIIKL